MPERSFEGGSALASNEELSWGEDVVVGPDVRVECDRLWVGNGVRLGVPTERESFRYPGGIRIRGTDVRLSDGVRIGRHALIEGGAIHFGRDVQIGNGVSIRVLERLRVGAGGSIQDRGEIGGIDIEIGRRLWMLPEAKIGGGGAFEVHSRLRIGHWAHLGLRTLLNTARPITIGDEVGLGTGTALYTHGAYPSAIEGKPVGFAPIQIGDRTWLPGATVNPGVTIGADVVVAVGSVVTRDLPDGCLAAGSPAKVVREKVYPKEMDGEELAHFMTDFLSVFAEVCSDQATVKMESSHRALIGATAVSYQSGSLDEAEAGDAITITQVTADAMQTWREDRGTIIGLRDRKVLGSASVVSERLLNQLRRYGIRFNYDAVEGRYLSWSSMADDLA